MLLLHSDWSHQLQVTRGDAGEQCKQTRLEWSVMLVFPTLLLGKTVILN